MAEAVAAGAAVAAAVIQTKTTLWDPLKHTIESSNDMDEIYRALAEAMERLVAKRDDHQYTVQKHMTTRIPSNTYTNWIHRVSMVKDEVEKLKTSYTNERRRSKWFCINPRSRLTENMRKKGLQVISCVEEGSNLGDFLIDKEPVRVIKMLAPEITNIRTLQRPLEQILGWLSDIKVTGIRIHGLVGSGKTTIMQNLNNHEKVAQMFDMVIWVTVSREESEKNIDVDQIQQGIVQRLKLNIENAAPLDRVALRIREELTNMKYLLLFDDVKEDLDLHRIGIPSSGNGSKVVFTTRLQHVCLSIADRHAKVEKLDKKEALIMFKNVLGRLDLEQKSNFRRLMPLIVDLCGYHPLMIKVAAGVFRVNDTEQNWHDGLRKLRKWPEKGDDSMQETYKLLKCCFDYLTGNRKLCFFYSALYPEESDIHKDCLLDNWAAEELLGADDDVEELRVNGRDVLEHLKKISLLEESICQRHIRMHKLIRQAALYNLSTNEDPRTLVKCGKALQNTPNVESWKEKRWISLVDGEIDTLPHQPDCSILKTLFLHKNPNLNNIPKPFFEHMQSLCVLDLYGTGITTLPDSLLKLVSLKALYLQLCVALVELPFEIENLRKLEVLDIRGSGLRKVPPQIESLICLRRLLVSFSSSRNGTHNQAAVQDCKVISKISTLKELVIDVEDGFEGVLHDVIVNVDTVTRLSLLQFCSRNQEIDVIKAIGDTRKIHFPTENHLRSYMEKTNGFDFTSCQVFIGCHISSDPHIAEFSPYYRFGGEVSTTTISEALCNAGTIELVNHNEIEHLSVFSTQCMNQVRGCVIEACNKIRTVVDGNTGSNAVLSNLEQLHMINLPVLKNICEGPMMGFSKLKTLILCDCPMLTWVCAHGVILQLPEIRHLEVKGCSSIEQLFMQPANVVSPILPKLKELILADMPQLRSVLLSSSFEWPSLKRLKIHGCPTLKRLPFEKDTAVKLSSIEAERSWWEALENDEEVKEQFRPYCTFS